MPGRSTCTRCDASLPAPDLDGTQVCIGCGRYHGADPDEPEPSGSPLPPPPPPPPPPPGPAGPFGAQGTSDGASLGGGYGTPPPPGGPFSAGPQKVDAPKGKKRKKGGIGCLLVVLLVAFGLVAATIGVVVWIVDEVDEAGDGSGILGDQEFRPLGGEMGILRDGEDGEPEEVVALASQYGTGDRSVVLAELDDEGGEVVWEAALVPDDVYTARFAATDDLVIAGLGRQVTGLDRSTGETAWQTDLPDVLSPSCSDCLQIVDDHVVAFSSDAQVTVIDPADGTALWSRRLEAASGWVKPFGDRLLVVDEPAGGAATVTLTEVADGAEVSTHTPTCPDPIFEGDTIDASPSVLVLEQVPETEDLVAQFAFGRACTTRWEATTGTVRWARASELSVDTDAEAALTPTDMVTSSSQGLLHVSLAEGTVTLLPAPADSYMAGPVWVTGSTAVGVATTTRGTSKPLVVAYDLRTREQLWSIDDLPPGAEPMIPGDSFGATIFPGGATFLVAPDADGLTMVTIESGGRLTVESVDPATGRTEIVGTDVLAGASADSSTSVYLESMGPDDVVVTVDAIVQVVDLATGTVTESWTG